ncbi:M23 family metallopeptidase [Paraburkholderia franconis]|nr:M23 family metallopeptidase [Paraburkholderia franconis]
MIISPPFLSAAQPDAGNTVVPGGNVCTANMLECTPGGGAYPVSFNLGWHGGVHLMAPSDGNQAAYVRAIADGKIVYLRKTGPNGKPTLHYRNVRTDDGCVVIRHDTEIGEGDNARVTYYSVYLHLQTVQPTLAVGQKIYRKDVLGTPGQIYGQYPQIHFEIVCDEASLKKFIGRAPGPVGAQGRTDAIYGDTWFFVPHGTKLFANEPHPFREDDSAPATAMIQPQPSLVPAGTSRDLVIRMRYEKDCTLTTYQQDADGNWLVFGAMPAERDAEYNLYQRATALHDRFTDSSLAGIGGATVAPSPSAIFEILSFGRGINDRLGNGQRFNHWRKMKTPDGDGWINLSKAGVRVYSDADFPGWAGWSFVSDDPTPDSLCDSPTVKRWLDIDRSGHISHAKAVQALNVETVRQRMAHAVCKFPTEWSKAGLEARYNWLKNPHEALTTPLSDADFNTLMDHARDLAFWEDVSDPDFPPPNECWHFPPTAFVRQFRACNWLTVDELAQCLPRRSLTGQTPWDEAHRRATEHQKAINALRRKYLGESTVRFVHFLAQTYIETGILSLVSEGGAGHGKSYGPFFGRGYLQLTWPNGYDEYGKFRLLSNITGSVYSDPRISTTSTHQWSSGGSVQRWYPRYDPARVASSLADAAESSGMFWISKHFRGKNNINRAADLGVTPAVVGFISWLINGGAAGYANRQQFAALIFRILSDDTSSVSHATISYPPLTPPGQPTLCHSFPPAPVTATLSIQVSYEPQIP